MNKQKELPRTVTVVNKPSIVSTLLQLKQGEPTKFLTSQFKAQNVRVAMTKLKAKKINFTLTEVGMVNEYIVTRLK